MKLINKLLNFADKFDMLPKTGAVLTCVSGGADSMCLLDMLLSIARKREFTVAVAHYNHNLRGEESHRDETFVRNYCAQLGIPFYCSNGDVNEYARDNGLGTEEAARTLRYEFFQETLSRSGAANIATAHTSDDNAETIIMNLTRGAGAKGCSGIPPVRGNIIRPMLQISRDEVMTYIAEHGVPYVEDSTNSLDIYTRNKVRHNVLPILRDINPRLNDALDSSAELFRADEEYLSDLADRFIHEHCSDGAADAEKIKALPLAISTRVVRKLYGGSLSRQHVKAVLDLCSHENPSASLSLPGKVVYREYSDIVFDGNPVLNSFMPVHIEDGVETEIPELGFKISCKTTVCSDKINNSLTSFLFKYDELCGKIIVRSRTAGDTIKLPGGTKSLKKLFIERKIPQRERELIPVISDDMGILAVYGIAVGTRAVPELGDTALLIEFYKNA